MKRVLLKLSGEALAGDRKTGFDEDTVRKVAVQVKTITDLGTQVGIVIGGGNAAVDAAEYLSKLASKLYLIQRSELRADAAAVKRLRGHANVELLLHTEPRALSGDARLTAATLFDRQTETTRELSLDAVFVNIGVEPNTALFADQVKLDEAGSVVAGEDCRTNLPGVFAAGDVRTKEVRQLTTAAADGTAAALGAVRYLRSLENGKKKSSKKAKK